MKVIARNRKAKRDYEIVEEYDAGIVLKGAEVKSVRAGQVSISDAYAVVEDDEVFLYNMHISNYKPATHTELNPKRKRKLLLHKREINRLFTRINQRGFTMIPLMVYLSDRGLVKILLGLGKGRKKYDKREDIKEKDHEKDIDKYVKDR